jgi:hypothetical protein
VFDDRPSGTPASPRRTTADVEQRIVTLRRQLLADSPLGEFGAAAVHTELLRQHGQPVPSIRTIGRVFARNGLLDADRRIRRPAPPPGWFLPDLARRCVELDSFDTVVDLVIRSELGRTDVTVLNGISLHGRLCASWPCTRITSATTCDKLVEHWTAFGLPRYVKFDNDTVFQGARIKPDTFGRVTRLCLQLSVIPVFAPPRESGFQADVESFNGRWQAKVFRRFNHQSLDDLLQRGDAFVTADRTKNASHIDAAPTRTTFPDRWIPDWQRPLAGKVIFLRRTNDAGHLDVLGRTYLAARHWTHRLARVEVDLANCRIDIFALRRREPTHQPLLATYDYQVPSRRFIE